MAERLREQRKAESFRTYIADSVNLMAQGKYKTKLYSELLNPAPEIDAKAIVDRIEGRLNGEPS